MSEKLEKFLLELGLPEDQLAVGETIVEVVVKYCVEQLEQFAADSGEDAVYGVIMDILTEYDLELDYGTDGEDSIE